MSVYTLYTSSKLYFHTYFFNNVLLSFFGVYAYLATCTVKYIYMITFLFCSIVNVLHVYTLSCNVCIRIIIQIIHMTLY